MTADAAHVAAVARAMCAEHDWDTFTEQWESNRDYWMALAAVAVETLTPLIRAQVAAEIRNRPTLTPRGAYCCYCCERAARIAEGTP